MRDDSRAALGVIQKGRSADAVRAALDLLPEGHPGVREAVLAGWERIAASPRRLDADCSIRAALLRGLRACALPADRAVLERAAQTYEHSYSGEAAANLRAAAVLTLSEVDPQAAAFHAVRLLREAAPGTGEPALSAARLLHVLGQPLPLYAHLLGAAQGEVAAQCFQGLADAPDSLLLDLAERWGGRHDEVAALGLLDLLLDVIPGRPEPQAFEAVLLAFLRESPHLDLVRYLATAVVARRLVRVIEAMRRGPWPAPARRRAVEEALALLAE